MVTLCTHCKKVETDDEEMRYCIICLVKLRKWIEEPREYEETKGIKSGQELLDNEVKQLYEGKIKR